MKWRSRNPSKQNPLKHPSSLPKSTLHHHQNRPFIINPQNRPSPFIITKTRPFIITKTRRPKQHAFDLFFSDPPTSSVQPPPSSTHQRRRPPPSSRSAIRVPIAITPSPPPCLHTEVSNTGDFYAENSTGNFEIYTVKGESSPRNDSTQFVLYRSGCGMVFDREHELDDFPLVFKLDSVLLFMFEHSNIALYKHRQAWNPLVEGQ